MDTSFQAVCDGHAQSRVLSSPLPPRPVPRRFYNLDAIQTIIRMAAANGVGRVWVGKGGLMSTPAVSAVLREREGGAAYAGLVLTARCAQGRSGSGSGNDMLPHV